MTAPQDQSTTPKTSLKTDEHDPGNSLASGISKKREKSTVDLSSPEGADGIQSVQYLETFLDFIKLVNMFWELYELVKAYFHRHGG